ncbi:hypothetical protein JZ751_002824 [Albula glossodonta]|uniref:Uncharacterized protein n=1 Tax=Albula glossodonta TaxID=121402 RepID=A0A8T2NJ78_9TELE|nr:hypothetical protein JZ751_002824 [Albula glossodonta]
MSSEEVSRASNEVTSARPRDTGLTEALRRDAKMMVGEVLKSPLRQTNRYRSAVTDRYEGIRKPRYLLLVGFRDAPSESESHKEQASY